MHQLHRACSWTVMLPSISRCVHPVCFQCARVGGSKRRRSVRSTSGFFHRTRSALKHTERTAVQMPVGQLGYKAMASGVL